MTFNLDIKSQTREDMHINLDMKISQDEIKHLELDDILNTLSPCWAMIFITHVHIIWVQVNCNRYLYNLASFICEYPKNKSKIYYNGFHQSQSKCSSSHFILMEDRGVCLIVNRTTPDLRFMEVYILKFK